MSVGCAKVWTHRYLGHVTERAGAWANLEDMWLANMFGMLETPGYARSQGLPLGDTTDGLPVGKVGSYADPHKTP